MRHIAISIALASFSFSIFAEDSNRLACWNVYAKSGSRPVLTAEVVNNTVLETIRLDFSDRMFEFYSFEEKEKLGDHWKGQLKYEKSWVFNPEGLYESTIVDTKRSPYYGNQEFRYVFGSYRIEAPYIDPPGSWDRNYEARLILPVDISAENLKTFRFHEGSRVNAVMIYPPSPATSQSGDNYLRMHCRR